MKLIARLIILGLATVSLGAVAVYAAANPSIVTQAQNIISTTVDDILPPEPSPDPTPTPVDIPPPPDPSPIPTDVPTPPPPPAPKTFPHNPGPTQTVNGAPQEQPVPQTDVFIGATCDQPCSDGNTGGIKCIAPCTITFTADFQGGFPGVTPTFKWSDGATGQVHIVTYTVAGKPHISVVASEVYQGIKYEVGSANSIPILIE